MHGSSCSKLLYSAHLTCSIQGELLICTHPGVLSGICCFLVKVVTASGGCCMVLEDEVSIPIV